MHADMGLRRAKDGDAFTFVVIDPEFAVTAACSAIAGGRTGKLPIEAPLNIAAQTRALNHFNRSSLARR